MLDPTDFLRIAVDPVRLAILGAASRGPVDPDGLADDLGVPVKKVLTQLGRLQTSGLVTPSRELDTAILREIREQLPSMEAASDAVVDGPWTAEEQGTLRTFFKGDRLDQIPTNRAKRLVVLERLAQEFEPGIRYPERQVNFMLQLFHSDYAALRRYLVDEAMLTRADGVYWRSGGRFLDGIDAEEE